MDERASKLIKAAELGDAIQIEQLLSAGCQLDCHTALNKAISQGHSACVALLGAHVDLTHNSCMYFRAAVAQRNIECARILIPPVHPNLIRGYIYVEDILSRKIEQTSEENRVQLLQLCAEVFDMKDENSRALRTAVAYNAQYAIDVLFPLSDVPVALKHLRNQRQPLNSDILENLQARFERECLLKHIEPSISFSVRKM